jgi:hypothetical protein
VSAIAYAVVTLHRCAGASRSLVGLVEEDPLERRLLDKELRLVLGLGRRSVRALGRASLFAGTGLGVWALTGGSAHYFEAGVAFGLGLLSWAVCGEAERRIGSLADALRKTSDRLGVDQSKRTG